MRVWVLVFWIAVAVLVVLGFFYLYPGATGRFVQFLPSDYNEPPPNPNIKFSPLPTDSPLKDAPTVTVDCSDARKLRDDRCDLFSKRYDSGCHWYLFWDYSYCKNLRTACLNAQDQVTKMCVAK